LPVFTSKPGDEFICMFFSERSSRTETTKSLYFDTQTREFFVVEETEYESGPNVTCSFTRQVVSDEAALATVSREPEGDMRARRFLAEN
jgi:hypothetical protein